MMSTKQMFTRLVYILLFAHIAMVAITPEEWTSQKTQMAGQRDKNTDGIKIAAQKQQAATPLYQQQEQLVQLDVQLNKTRPNNMSNKQLYNWLCGKISSVYSAQRIKDPNQRKDYVKKVVDRYYLSMCTKTYDQRTKKYSCVA